MRFLLSILFTCVIGYVLFVAWLYFTQRSILYHPEKELYALSSYKLKDTQEITLTTYDGIKLEAWYRKPKDKKHMVIFLHGNAGNLGDRVDKLKALIDLGYGFLIPAWRGFGNSEGEPTMSGLYFDAEAAIDFVRAQGYKIDETIIIGESLGTGIATEMATKYRFKGLFLITPYTSIANRAEELYPIIMAKAFVKDNYDVIDKISFIEQPLLIIHGDKDDIVPYQHSEEIFAKSKQPKKLIIYPGINHVNYDKAEVFKQMDQFFN